MCPLSLTVLALAELEVIILGGWLQRAVRGIASVGGVRAEGRWRVKGEAGSSF